jgi:hypothetical protein
MSGDRLWKSAIASSIPSQHDQKIFKITKVPFSQEHAKVMRTNDHIAIASNHWRRHPEMNQLNLPASTRYAVYCWIGGLTVAAIPFVTTASVQAQIAAPLQDSRAKDDANFFSGQSGDATSSFTNMMLRALQGPSVSAEEFASDKRESIDKETANFRKQQADRLRQQAPQSSTPAVLEVGTPKSN